MSIPPKTLWRQQTASNSPMNQFNSVNPQHKENDRVPLNLKIPKNLSIPQVNPLSSPKLIPSTTLLVSSNNRYSDSEDDSPKKASIVKPAWAESPVLMAHLKRQQMINPDDVFGEIKPPAIDDIFKNNNRRGHSTFRPRSSSANWNGQDKLTREEIEEYARTMGYSKP
jgi:Inner centromere protein, ARK binding region